jgi:hypothetical protein
MRKTFFLIGLINSCILSLNGFAQTTASNESQRVADKTRIEQQAQRDREFERMKRISEAPAVVVKRQALSLKTQLNGKQKKLLLPSEKDLNTYAIFLQQPKTGLIKLFPDPGCEDNGNILRADEKCLNWIPHSSFYSFREKEHTNDYLSDLRYKDGFLISDSILLQGILTALGDVPLEDLSLSNDGLKFLLDYQPQTETNEALNQFTKLTKGIKDGKYEYKKVQPAVENITYALRVIAYRGHFYQRFHGMMFDVLDGDKRVDLVLAFRVVRIDTDGSLTLLWKELARNDSPKLIPPKKNKNRDFKPTKYQG